MGHHVPSSFSFDSPMMTTWVPRCSFTWTTLGGYLDMLQHKGISPNVASFVGAATVRENLLGEADVQPTPTQLAAMQALVKQAMEEGALGLTDALIYSPNTYAKTPELIALAKISARCGGEYIAHIRSEGDRLEQAVQESIDIAQASGAPAEIYHFKQAGRSNWGKLDRVIAMIEASRAKGVRISANMYNYTAGATGLDAAMPSWVQDGGLEKWIARLKDPAIRARVKAEMLNAHPKTWENLYAGAGAEGTLLLAFKNPKLKPLTGKTLASNHRFHAWFSASATAAAARLMTNVSLVASMRPSAAPASKAQPTWRDRQ